MRKICAFYRFLSLFQAVNMLSWLFGNRRGHDQTKPAAAAGLIEPLECRRLLSAGPRLVLQNLDPLPNANQMIFNRIAQLDSKVPNRVHSTAQLELMNVGSPRLRIRHVGISGPWEIVGKMPTSIPSHGSRTITLRFNATTPPPFTFNQTNETTNPTEGGVYTGMLVIRTNAKTHRTRTESLAGWFQQHSENNEEPDLQSVINLISGYQTQIASGHVNDLSESSGKTLYGEEINSAYWKAANARKHVVVQQLSSWHTQGDPQVLAWYTRGQTTTNKLMTTAANEGQTFLPHMEGSPDTLAAAGFKPRTKRFGFKIDYEWSDDARNFSAGGGHHIRFYPVRDAQGNLVPNTYFMVLDYSVAGSGASAENFDFQDAVYVVSNVVPVGN
jgi:hypothetical protein